MADWPALLRDDLDAEALTALRSAERTGRPLGSEPFIKQLEARTGPSVPMMLIRERVVFPEGDLVEMVVWRVPKPVAPTTHGFKYRLAYIIDGRRALGYDNERGKGDHRHREEREEPFVFVSVDKLMEQFVSEIEELRRRQ